jgi:bifunctional non-homologous end joining protein LigD
MARALRKAAPARDPLAEYNAKRDFKKTAEPAGKRATTAGDPFGGGKLVVQKHDASRLHWDLRLEVDGVLKSWAVAKGPSPDPEIKRLAVQTEDHPMAYGEFEGTIPKGEYGGGTVMLWDRGTWAPIPGKSARDLEKGHLHFVCHGERMKGEWLLIRLKPRPGEKRFNWLLRKLNDEYAEEGDVLVERAITSVLTGRSMAEIAADKKGEHSLAGVRDADFVEVMARNARHTAKLARNKILPGTGMGTSAAGGGGTRRGGLPPSGAGAPATSPSRGGTLPRFRPPQLATLVDAVPAGNDWFHEIKFDGYRALVAACGQKVVVYTRNGLDWTDKFAPLAKALAGLDLPASLIDGEIVAYDKNGNPDFSSLQATLKRGHGAQTYKTPLSFHAFDLLELEGRDLTALPNIERKERLEALLARAAPPIHVADHVIGAGEKLFRTMCEAGQEGIISKRIDGKYSDRRSRNWLKVKCILRQEFVVIGWKKSSARGRPFSSLLLAQNEGGKLVYKGNVGTGFNMDRLADLAARMDRLTIDKAASDVPREDRRGVTWIRPELVAEIAFSEFTAQGTIRHGSFIGLREDKKAADVVPERAEHLDRAPELIKISSRERVIYETGETKGQLADYYQAVAPLMLPWLANRPISLVRCPQGRGKKCFFQKHDAGAFGPHVRQVPIAEKNGQFQDYIYVDSAEGLLTCVQMGTIEFHGWGSRSEDVEAPDRMVIDLDPDEGLDFKDVKRAAKDVHDRLEDIGLVSFAMLTGGKGIHVVVPLLTGHDWDRHKDFARRFAEALAMAEPERFVSNMAKAKRVGKIFIDYLRNQRGATAVLPFSARSRPGAPVAAPIAWGELDGFDNAQPWSIADADTLLRRAKGKGLAGWGFAEQALPDL